MKRKFLKALVLLFAFSMVLSGCSDLTGTEEAGKEENPLREILSGVKSIVSDFRSSVEKTGIGDPIPVYDDDETEPIYEDDLDKPIMEDDLERPIYDDDETGPIYGDDPDKPIYEDDFDKPIMEDDETQPIYGDDPDKPILVDDETQPIYEDDLDNPILVDDETQPIYEDDESQPIYGDDTDNPIYGDDETKPIMVDDPSKPIMENDTDNPIYGDDETKPIMVDDPDNPNAWSGTTSYAFAGNNELPNLSQYGGTAIQYDGSAISDGVYPIVIDGNTEVGKVTLKHSNGGNGQLNVAWEIFPSKARLMGDGNIRINLTDAQTNLNKAINDTDWGPKRSGASGSLNFPYNNNSAKTNYLGLYFELDTVTGYGQMIIGYDQMITGYGQKVIGYEQVLIGYDQMIVGYGQKVIGYEQVLIGYEQIIVDYVQKVVGYEQKITGYDQIIVDYVQKVVGYEQKITGYDQMIIGYGKKIIGYEQILTGYEQMITGYGKKLLGYEYESYEYQRTLEKEISLAVGNIIIGTVTITDEEDGTLTAACSLRAIYNVFVSKIEVAAWDPEAENSPLFKEIDLNSGSMSVNLDCGYETGETFTVETIITFK